MLIERRSTDTNSGARHWFIQHVRNQLPEESYPTCPFRRLPQERRDSIAYRAAGFFVPRAAVDKSSVGTYAT